MKIKTNTLIGPALDWAVATIEQRLRYRNGLLVVIKDGKWIDRGIHEYSTRWSQGGPIIERERISLHDGGNYNRSISREYCWRAMGNALNAYWGATMLIAAMRCYVASKLGEEIDVPEELL